MSLSIPAPAACEFPPKYSVPISYSLPNLTISGSPLAECIQYAGFTYNSGSVRTADVYMGGANNQGEVAKAIPIQILAPAGGQDSTVPTEI